MSDEREMVGSWDFYPVRINDQVASILLDMSREPEDRLPWLLCVRVTMNAPLESGLSSGAEAAQLDALEDKLTAAMGLYGAEFVARLTMGGFREFFYYAQEEEPVAEILDEVVPGSGYRTAWRCEHDPQWSFFREFLFPDIYGHQWMMCRKVVSQLKEHGDQVAQPRPVDHYLYFPDEVAQRLFIEAVEPLGFEAEARENHGVHLVREDSVELSHIHEVACALIQQAVALGGDYDGWGAPIVST